MKTLKSPIKAKITETSYFCMNMKQYKLFYNTILRRYQNMNEKSVFLDLNNVYFFIFLCLLEFTLFSSAPRQMLDLVD